MHPPVRLACLLAAFLLGAATSLRGGLFELLLGRPEAEVIVVTDMTAEGRRESRPSPANPVYYVPISVGFQELGAIVAGEKIPGKEAMEHIIMATLAKQGFLPVTQNSPAAAIVLAFAWGTLNADNDSSLLSSPPIVRNRQQILKFLGGYKLGFSDSDFDPLMPTAAGLTQMNSDSREFFQMAADNYYVAVVTAYDMAAARQKGPPRKLWTTRISCPSRGFWLEEVMPTMLSIAAPNFGRETDRPVWIRASDKYQPDVRLGELKLLEYLGPEKPAVATGDDPAKALPPTTRP